MADDNASEDDLLMYIIRGLRPLDDQAKARLLTTVWTYFDLEPEFRQISSITTGERDEGPSTPRPTFSANPEMPPKEFLHGKAPRTDIERIACLGYYLAHFRNLPHFTTIDISKLNTEAAQLKLSNASQAMFNAERRGLIAPAAKGKKQVSAIGEKFVDALPDRDAAKRVLDHVKGRRRGEGGKKAARKSPS
jgi:hypothetical protein